MSDVSTEQKLRLIQQVRSRYDRNQFDLSNRERIIYGKSYTKSSPIYGEKDSTEPDTAPPYSTFKLRLALAFLLGLAIISMDKRDIKIAGITSDQIFQAISADFEENIEEMVSAMSNETTADTITDD